MLTTCLLAIFKAVQICIGDRVLVFITQWGSGSLRYIPKNFAFTVKGNDSGPETLEDIVKAGAAGLKFHELSPYI